MEPTILAAVQDASKDNALLLQRLTVPRVPVRTGKLRGLFASPAAIGKSRKVAGASEFGLRTPAQKRKGYYAIWLEYGAKAARTRTGRSVPARPAHPFLAPAIEAARPLIAGAYEMRLNVALARFTL